MTHRLVHPKISARRAALAWLGICCSCLAGSIAVSPDGRHVFVVDAGAAPGLVLADAGSGTELQRLPLEDAFLGLAVAPKGDRLFVSGGAKGGVYEVRRTGGRLEVSRFFPLPKSDFVAGLALAPDGRLLYAANLFRNSLTVLNPLTGFVVAEVATGRRPYAIAFAPDGKTFWVSHTADGSIGVYDAADGARLASVPVGPHPTGMAFVPGAGGPPGGPRYLGRLFVACSNTNSVMVLGLSEGNQLELIGRVTIAPGEFAPLGSTPAAVAPGPDAKRLYVACSDNDTIAVLDIEDYRAELAGFVPAPPYPVAVLATRGRLFMAGSASWTSRALPGDNELTPPAGLPEPKDWNSPPVQHVIYVLAEGRLGDGPNARKLAREFGRLDAVSQRGETAAENYQWSSAAIANHLVRKLAPARRAGRLRRDLVEASDPAAFPPAGYLWTNALSAGLTVRSYGFPRGRDPALAPYSRPAEEFFREFPELARRGAVPHLVLVRLSASDPDAALGRLVETVAQGPAWPQAAIFALPEHEPGPAFLAGPFIRRGCAPENSWSTLSLLRTAELLLGLQPMTQFDAAAAPVSACFVREPDARAFTAVPR